MENLINDDSAGIADEGTSIRDAGDGYPEFLLKIANKKKKTSVLPVSSEKDDLFYNMNFKHRGVAVIFNHEIFDHPTLKARNGTKADCRNLCAVLSNLQFEVRDYLDLTVHQIQDVVEHVSQKIDHSDSDCFFMAILSHGERGTIYAKDSDYNFDVIMDQFTPEKCPSLAGKPKLFLIQACQGDRLDAGIELEFVQVDAVVTNYRIPLYADFLLAYSTIPGFYSWRNTEKGSWFVQAFCNEVYAHGTEYDLLTLLTFVNRRVAVDFESNVPTDQKMHKQKQIPCITSMLTRLVKFSTK